MGVQVIGARQGGSKEARAANTRELLPFILKTLIVYNPAMSTSTPPWSVTIERWRIPQLAFALAIPFNAWAKGSLNDSGAATAILFAVITLVLCPTTVFATALLVFFYIGSRATKHKASVKAKLEEQENATNTFASADAPAVAATLTGSRSAVQVICNGLLGVAACAAWIYQFGSNYPVGGFTMGDGVTRYLPGGAYDVKTSCPLAVASGVKTEEQRLSNALIFCAVGFFAACMGDTLASELGMLAKTQPFLITTFKKVHPGTNGGVTPWGFLVSLLGGLLVGIASAGMLAWENKSCVTLSLKEIQAGSINQTALLYGALAAVSGAAGLFGSIIDSILGATVQQTLYSKKRKLVVHSTKVEDDEDKVVKVNGLNILSNNAVNFIASGVTGLAAGYIGYNFV